MHAIVVKLYYIAALLNFFTSDKGKRSTLINTVISNNDLSVTPRNLCICHQLIITIKTIVPYTDPIQSRNNARNKIRCRMPVWAGAEEKWPHLSSTWPPLQQSSDLVSRLPCKPSATKYQREEQIFSDVFVWKAAIASCSTFSLNLPKTLLKSNQRFATVAYNFDKVRMPQ